MIPVSYYFTPNTKQQAKGQHQTACLGVFHLCQLLEPPQHAALACPTSIPSLRALYIKTFPVLLPGTRLGPA